MMGWEKVFNQSQDEAGVKESGNTKQSVLIIDDEERITSTLVKYLDLEGFDPIAANDAYKGLELYHSLKPPIIITDILMPGKSGLELLEEIRNIDQETEIIVVTGHGDLDTAITALKYQASDFILKPIDFDILLLTLNRASERIGLRQKVKNYTSELEVLLKKVDTSKKYLETVFQNSPNALITYDLSGAISSWNSEAENITGFSQSEVLGKSLEQVLRLDNILLDLSAQVQVEKNVTNSVAQILTKERQLRYINRNASSIKDQDDKVIGGIESFIDLTEQIKSERLLEKRYLQVQTINDISKMVSTENDFLKISDFVIDSLHKSFFESSLLAIYFYEKKEDALVLKSLTGQGKELLPDGVKPGKKYAKDRGIPGKVYQSGKAITVENVPSETEYFRSTLSEAFSAFAFPIHSKTRTYGILSIENAERIHLDESDQFMLDTISEFLGISAHRIQLLNQITHQNRLLEKQAGDLRTVLRKVNSQKETIEKQNTRLIEDLQKAGDFQKSLLPKSLPKYPNIDFAASYLPSSQLGGDIYDIFAIDEELVGVILADASGHGVAAAMLSAMFKMTLQKYAAEIIDPAQVMQKLNSDFCQVLQMGEFFTAFYAVLNRHSGQFVYCNAGHPRPLLYSYADGGVQELDTEGFLLGVMDDNITFEQKELTLDNAHRLVIYTDGVNEAIDEKQVMYGDDRVRMRLLERANNSAGEFIDALHKDLKKFAGSVVFEDDITVLVMDYEAKKESE